MKPRAVGGVVCMLATLLVAVSACGSAQTSVKNAGTSPDRLVIIGVPLPPALYPESSPLTIRSQGLVRELYAETLSLPPFPKGVFSCPIADGGDARMTFFSGAHEILIATVQLTGCIMVQIAGHPPTREPTTAFLTHLLNATAALYGSGGLWP